MLLQGSNGSLRRKDKPQRPMSRSLLPMRIFHLDLPANSWWKRNTRSTTRCTTSIATVAWLLPPIRSIFHNRRHYYAMHVIWSIWFHCTTVFIWSVGWVENGGYRVINENCSLGWSIYMYNFHLKMNPRGTSQQLCIILEANLNQLSNLQLFSPGRLDKRAYL